MFAHATHRFALASALIVTTTAADAAGNQSFDGTWNVAVECTSASNAVKGYTWAFPTQIRNGALVGQYGTRGATPSGTLSGQIDPNGNAVLQMTGLTGEPGHTLGRVSVGTPFRYTATVHFGPNSGTGKRNQGRECTFTFVRA